MLKNLPWGEPGHVHRDIHPRSGDFFTLNLLSDRTVHLVPQDGQQFQLKDWADRVKLEDRITMQQKSFAWNVYQRRLFGSPNLPKDYEVVFGYTRGGAPFFAHISELK